MNRQNLIYAKSAVLAVIIAIPVGLTLMSGLANEQARSLAKSVLGWPAEFVIFIFALMGEKGALFAARFETVALEDFLPITSAVVLAIKTVLLLSGFPRRRPLIDRIFPSPPDILNLSVDDVYTVKQTIPQASEFHSESSEFIGRKDIMSKLMYFSGKAAGAGCAVYALEGGEGMGKSRTAQEWLKSLKDLGWDTGYLANSVNAEFALRTHFRRKTAIVIDEVGRSYPDLNQFWSLISVLSKQKKHRLRVLLVDQAIERPALDTSRDLITDVEAVWPKDAILEIHPLSEMESKTLAPDLSEAAIKKAEGRPLLLHLGDNPIEEITRRAERRLSLAESIRGKDAVKTLLISIFAGPISFEGLTDIKSFNSKIRNLRKIFEGKNKAQLKKELPILDPALLADYIFLTWADNRPDAIVKATLKPILSLNEVAAKRRFKSLNSRALSAPQLETLRLLQKIYDEVYPQWAEETKTESERLLQLSKSLESDRLDETRKFLLIDKLELALTDTALSRPFDTDIGITELSTIANIIASVNTNPDNIGRVEYWGQRAMRASQRLPNNLDVSTFKLACIVNTLNGYRKTALFEDVERWGAQLHSIARAFPNSPEISLDVLQGIMNILGTYLKTSRFDDIERWASYIPPIVERYPNNAVFRAKELSCVLNILSSYNKTKRFDDLERWASHIAPAVKAFPDSYDIRNAELKCIVNILNGYNKTKRFDDLERWASRIAPAVNMFPDNPNIRHQELNCITNILRGYNKTERFDDIERWASRIAPAVKMFPDNPNIRHQELNCITNILNAYNKTERLSDLERWASRIVPAVNIFPDNADIRHSELKCITNILSGYNRARRIEDVLRWSLHIDPIVQAFPENPDIRNEAVKCAQNILNGLGHKGQQGSKDWLYWKSEIAASALKFPFHSEIQERAHIYGVTYASQQKKAVIQ